MTQSVRIAPSGPALTIPDPTAPNISFAPTTPANWPFVNPETVQAALDGLAQKGAAWGRNASPDSGANVNQPNLVNDLQPVKSGLFAVFVSLAANYSVPGDATFYLLVDGGVVNAATFTKIAGANAPIVLFALVQLDRTITHDFGLNCVPVAGTVSIDANEAAAICIELGG